MSTYKPRASDQSKTILVNPLGYSSTLEIGHRFKQDTSVNQDMVRLSIASALNEHINTCSSSACGDIRREVVSLSMAMLLGQEPAYYARKLQMLNDVKASIDVLIAAWSDVSIGITPDFSSVEATVVPKVRTTPEA